MKAPVGAAEDAAAAALASDAELETVVWSESLDGSLDGSDGEGALMVGHVGYVAVAGSGGEDTEMAEAPRFSSAQPPAPAQSLASRPPAPGSSAGRLHLRRGAAAAAAADADAAASAAAAAAAAELPAARGPRRDAGIGHKTLLALVLALAISVALNLGCSVHLLSPPREVAELRRQLGMQTQRAAAQAERERTLNKSLAEAQEELRTSRGEFRSKVELCRMCDERLLDEALAEALSAREEREEELEAQADQLRRQNAALSESLAARETIATREAWEAQQALAETRAGTEAQLRACRSSGKKQSWKPVEKQSKKETVAAARDPRQGKTRAVERKGGAGNGRRWWGAAREWWKGAEAGAKGKAAGRNGGREREEQDVLEAREALATREALAAMWAVWDAQDAAWAAAEAKTKAAEVKRKAVGRDRKVAGAKGKRVGKHGKARRASVPEELHAPWEGVAVLVGCCPEGLALLLLLVQGAVRGAKQSPAQGAQPGMEQVMERSKKQGKKQGEVEHAEQGVEESPAQSTTQAAVPGEKQGTQQGANPRATIPDEPHAPRDGVAAGLGACCQPGMVHEVSGLALYTVRRVLECTARELKVRLPPCFDDIEVATDIDGNPGHSGKELLAAMALVVPTDPRVHRKLMEGCV